MEIIDELYFICPRIPPIASDRLRRCGLFAQISLPLQRFMSIAASYNNDVSSNVEL